MGRVVGLALLALIFAGSAFLLTCQKQPGGTARHYAPQRQSAPPKQTRSDSHVSKTAEERKPSEQETSESPAEQKPESAVIPQAPPAEESQPTETPAQATQPGEQSADDASRGRKRSSPTTRVVHGEVSRGNPQSTQVALTFDAGADPRPTPKILETLARHGVHATFFLTGKWIEKNRGLTERIIAEGHEIGNHTYSHRSLTHLSSGEIADEVEKTEQLVLDITGRSTKPYLRVPYGARDKRVLGILSDLG
jgi:hypothetical protein